MYGIFTVIFIYVMVLSLNLFSVSTHFQLVKWKSVKKDDLILQSSCTYTVSRCRMITMFYAHLCGTVVQCSDIHT